MGGWLDFLFGLPLEIRRKIKESQQIGTSRRLIRSEFANRHFESEGLVGLGSNF